MKRITALFTVVAFLSSATLPHRAYAGISAADTPTSAPSVFMDQKDMIHHPLAAAGASLTVPHGCSSVSAMDQEATLIVELSAKPLLEKFNEKTADLPLETTDNVKNSYAAFCDSKEADKMENRALNQQEKTMDKISDLLYDGADLEVKDQFTGIINAFVMEGNITDIAAIKKLPNVKNVYISQTYERITPDTVSGAAIETGTGSRLMHADQLPYQGEGMSIAILDTGLDTSHPAFNKTPAGQKYTKEKIDKILLDNTLASENLHKSPLSSADVYVNDKIPYAFDYCDNDTNVNPTKESIAIGNGHGTHVAGIAAASSEIMSGIAPMAQLMIMKVFSDTSRLADDSTCLAALEDCIMLDVDVINMSMGNACGYSYDENDLQSRILPSIKEAGINLIVSIGNNKNSSLMNPNNAARTSNPDTSTISSPSSYATSLAVAGANNSIVYTPCFRLNDSANISYEDLTPYLYNTNDSFAALSDSRKEFTYVRFSKEDTTIDVKGKIVVVDSAPNSYDEILQFAHQQGAIGLIITDIYPLNNTNFINYYFPIVYVSSSDCTRLLSQKESTFTVTNAFMPSDLAGQMYFQSSWGVTPDLLLKPEITAIGCNVYSTLPNNQYDNKSGTSMACPQVAGISTLVKEYIRKDAKYTNKEIGKKYLESLVSNLLMSTASPIQTECSTVSGSAVTAVYSPRWQGAGLVNAKAAIDTKALLYTTEGSGRPVLNLGDDVNEAGTYTKTFHIRNYSDDPLTYHLGSIVMTESCKSIGKNNYIAEVPTLLGGKVNYEFSSYSTDQNANTVSGSAVSAVSAGSDIHNTLVLAPLQDLEVTATITLTENDKDYIKTRFENGSFVEGFITLTSFNQDRVDLSLPFVGFFGDWTKAPLLDTVTTYDNPKDAGYEAPSNISIAAMQSTPNYYRYLSHLGNYSQMIINDGNLDIMQYFYFILGTNPYCTTPVFDKNKIAFSPNRDGILDNFLWSYVPLRGPKKAHYTITDQTGQTLYDTSTNWERKSIFNPSTQSFNHMDIHIDWQGKDLNGKALPNDSVVTFRYKGSLDYTKHEQNNLKDTIELPITIDTEAPTATDIKIDENAKTIQATVKDNQYVAAVLLYDSNANTSDSIRSRCTLDEEKKNTTTTVTLHYDEELKNHYLLSLIDYAGNTAYYPISDLIKNKPSPQILQN